MAGKHRDQTSDADVHATCIDMFSPFDARVVLHLDGDEFEGWVQYHRTTPKYVVPLMLGIALRRGWDLIEDYGDEYMGDGFFRSHLTTIETVCDLADDPDDELLPSLAPTGYGPYSGFMETIV